MYMYMSVYGAATAGLCVIHRMRLYTAVIICDNFRPADALSDTEQLHTQQTLHPVWSTAKYIRHESMNLRLES